MENTKALKDDFIRRNIYQRSTFRVLDLHLSM